MGLTGRPAERKVPAMRADQVKPGSVIETDEYTHAVRFPDGSGWWCTGSWKADDAPRVVKDHDGRDGWGWGSDFGPHAAREVEVLAEGLTRDRCLEVLHVPEGDVRAWVTRGGWMPGRLVGVAVFAVHIDDAGEARALLCRRKAGAGDGAGAWSCPGGCVEDTDDTLLGTAERELDEETGLSTPYTKLLDIAPKEGRRSNGQPYVTVFAQAKFRGPLPAAQDREPDKHEPWQWCDFREVRDLEGEVWDRAELIQVLVSLRREARTETE